jgi:hypothetical protein
LVISYRHFGLVVITYQRFTLTVIPYRRFALVAIPYRRFTLVVIPYRRFSPETSVRNCHTRCVIAQKSAVIKFRCYLETNKRMSRVAIT